MKKYFEADEGGGGNVDWQKLCLEKDQRIRELEEALQECDDYFDNYADADYIEEKYAPNPEMKLLSMIRQLLKS